MNIYITKLIKSILNNKNINATIIDSKNWNKISFFDFVSKSIYISNLLLNDCKLNKWDVVIAFTTNPIYYSILVLWTLMAWWKFVILEPTMWVDSINSKIRELKPKVWFYDSLLISYPFVDLLLLKLWIPNPYKIDSLEIISIWNSIFNKKWIKEININYIVNKQNYQNVELYEDLDAIVVFTWWTTSEPKWVIHTHKSIYYMLKEIKNITKDTKIFYADMPQFILLWIISWKNVIVWRSNYSNKKLLNIFQKHHIDTIFCPPYKFNDIMREKLKIPKSLKYLFFGSAPVYTWFLERIYKYSNNDLKIYSIYWMTEILPIAYMEWKEKIKLSWSINWDILWYPLDSIIYELNDDKELLLSWNHASEKYLWKEKHNFIQTWDLVDIIDYNWKKIFTLLWRKKDMIIKKEYNIYPSLYEKTINNIPFIKNAAIIWIWNKDKEDEEIILCVELENNYKSKNRIKTEKEIINLLKNWIYSIDNFALPDKITFIAIPCSGKQNKVNKTILKNNYLKLIWK